MASSPVSATFKIKRHARRPYLRLFVKDSDGNAFDFSGATGVRFQMKDEEDAAKVTDGAAEIEDAAGGILRYKWEPGNTDTAGDFFGEFDVDYPASETLTVPLDGDLLIKIKADVNNAG